MRREPPNSTERYTRWINQLAPDQLLTQVFFSLVCGVAKASREGVPGRWWLDWVGRAKLSGWEGVQERLSFWPGRGHPQDPAAGGGLVRAVQQPSGAGPELEGRRGL